MSEPFDIEREFGNTAESLPAAITFVEMALADLVAPEEVIERALLAVSEAIANAIEHGNRGEDTRSFWVGVRKNGAMWQIRVRDEGQAIAAADFQRAHLPRNPLQTHGRGLFIIRELADDVAVRTGALDMMFASSE
jgi:serine/threonine-protein kinase RsbW